MSVEVFKPEITEQDFSVEANFNNVSAKIKRTDNPLLYPLIHNPAVFSRFGEIVGKQIKVLEGESVRRVYVQEVMDNHQNYEHHFTVVEIPYSGFNEKAYLGLKNLMTQISQNPHLQEQPLTNNRDSKFMSTYMITSEVHETDEENPYLQPGFFFRKTEPSDKEGEGIPTSGILEMRFEDRHRDQASEVLTAYQVVMASMILSGRVDFSTQEIIKESLPMRRELFMDVYQEMLEEFMPTVEREQIYGVDSQIDDIDTNLYNPLKTGEGVAMNTLLVGAPGTGKSMMGRYFMADRSVLTVPADINKLAGFEHYVLPYLNTAKNIFDFPTVVFVDDVEGLLESGIARNGNGEMTQYVDPQKRSQALSLLERMQDTYGMYLLCTLNHPDVEAAFLRRFNSVYFPLPSADQRKNHLEKVIPTEHISPTDRAIAIDDITERSDGHNYNSIALISSYLENLTLKLDHDVGEDDFKTLLEVAFRKAGQRADVKGLAEFDQAAKRMMGIKLQEE